MSELTSDTTHYIVHTTGPDPSPTAVYGTRSPAYSGEKAMERAIKAAWQELKDGGRSFVTARNGESHILAVIPVVDYPVAKELRIPFDRQDVITVMFDGMDWTI